MLGTLQKYKLFHFILSLSPPESSALKSIKTNKGEVICPLIKLSEKYRFKDFFPTKIHIAYRTTHVQYTLGSQQKTAHAD